MKRTVISLLALCSVMGLSSCGHLGPEENSGMSSKKTTSSTTTSVPVSTLSEEDMEKAESVYVFEGGLAVTDRRENTQPAELDLSADTDELIAAMTLEQKIGQMFIVRPDALETAFSPATVSDDSLGGVTYLDDMMKEAMAKYHLGGIVFYDKNISGPEQLKTVISDMQQESTVPMFMAIDEQCGDNARVATTVGFDVAMFGNAYDIGEAGDAQAAGAMGRTIGSYLKELGFNLDLGVVADLSEDESGFSRNFSSNASEVTDMVTAQIEGLHESGMICAVKHFPGGREYDEPLNAFPEIGSSWQDLVEWDLIPFDRNMSCADMVMVGHVKLPLILNSDVPASMSEDIINGRLRTDYLFDGVVITAPMSDPAVRDGYESDKAAVEAVKAGADVILAPFDLDKAYEGLLSAVENGEISEKRIDQSLRRIIELKKKNGIIPSAKG